MLENVVVFKLIVVNDYTVIKNHLKYPILGYITMVKLHGIFNLTKRNSNASISDFVTKTYSIIMVNVLLFFIHMFTYLYICFTSFETNY